MVSMPMPRGLVTIKLPTTQELREMMTSPAVAITAIICATVLTLASVAGVVYLATTGHDSTVITAFIGGVLLAISGFLNSRIKGVKTLVEEVKAAQTKPEA